MAKRSKKTKKTQEKRGTNWLVIGGVVLVGVVGLFALLFLAIQRARTRKLHRHWPSFVLENDDNCVAIGSDNAPVTFVEVSDFGCPHCQAFHQEKAAPIKENYVDTGIVKWLYLPYALRPETVPAANAALCSSEQGKYSEFADALFNLPTEIALTRDGFITAAGEVGLEIDPFTACLEDGRYNNTSQRKSTSCDKRYGCQERRLSSLTIKSLPEMYRCRNSNAFSTNTVGRKHMTLPKDWQVRLIQLLAVPGMLTAYYLYLYHSGSLFTTCTVNDFFDCGQVSGPGSPYASIGPIPVALIGLLGYAAIFLVVWLRDWLKPIAENLPELIIGDR